MFQLQRSQLSLLVLQKEFGVLIPAPILAFLLNHCSLLVSYVHSVGQRTTTRKLMSKKGSGRCVKGELADRSAACRDIVDGSPIAHSFDGSCDEDSMKAQDSGTPSLKGGVMSSTSLTPVAQYLRMSTDHQQYSPLSQTTQ